MKNPIIALILAVVCLPFPAEAREKCMKVGCYKPWTSCAEGVRLPGGETVYGRTRDCCDVQGRWYSEAEECSRGRVGPFWWWDVGAFWGNERVERPLSGEQRFTDWQFDATGIEVGLTTRDWTFGQARLTPRFELGAGRAETSLRVADFETLSFRGTLWSAGTELTLRPCSSCPLSLLGGYRYSTIRDADPDSGFPVATQDFSATDLSVGLRYSLFDDRVQPALGVRFREADAGAALYHGEEGRTDLELDRRELTGSVDVRFTPSLSGQVEFAADGDDHRTGASLTYRFGGRGRAESSRPPPIPVPIPEPDPDPTPAPSAPEQDCSSGIPVCRQQYVQPIV